MLCWMQCHEGDVWLAATTRMHGMLCGAGYDGIDVDAVHCITWSRISDGTVSTREHQIFVFLRKPCGGEFWLWSYYITD